MGALNCGMELILLINLTMCDADKAEFKISDE